MKKIFNITKQAFTLAEVLMVMGILGVVAALTIPNLQSNIEDQQIVAKVQTMYADIDQAYKVALKKYDDNWEDSSYAPRVLEYMNTKSICDNNNASSCFASPIHLYDDSSEDFPFEPENISAIFNDGSSIYFRTNEKDALFDIDGKDKGYNTLGIDIFFISFGENGLRLETETNFSSVGNYTSWIIKFNNVDYLHCSTLKANGNTTCK